MEEKFEYVLVGKKRKSLRRIPFGKITGARYLPRIDGMPFGPGEMDAAVPLPEDLLKLVLEALSTPETISEPFGMFMMTGLFQFVREKGKRTRAYPAYGISGGGRLLSVMSGDTMLCYVLPEDVGEVLNEFFESTKAG